MTMPKSLAECTRENTPKWNFNGLDTIGRVVSVYDGDTMTVVFDTCDMGFYQHNVRLCDIDAPEIRGKSAEEKKAAIAARDYLCELALGKEIAFEVLTTDKYGRLLVSARVGKINLSARMLEAGHVKPYSGGTREPYVSTA